MEAERETEHLVARFVAELERSVRPAAVWVHGSWALGDYREGRSDLDLLALLTGPLDAEQRTALRRLHERLDVELPLAAKLHCSYLLPGQLADLDQRHLTWAHRTLFERPVTAVTRRELEIGGRTLLGPPPAGLVPPVGDAELARFIRLDLREFWLPATARWPRWLKDVWVDAGLITLARADATLRTGELLTKSQAIELLPQFGVPGRLVQELRERRYRQPAPPPAGWRWRRRRAEVTRRVLRAGIAATLGGSEARGTGR
ncbi:nucleotidyltransferase domain-containing protein [Kitasatospora nipponensis]|uniref:Nucleotidyltransferase domain-containing protein n=1 Tax=Kitasatospora nipponensis TaxID=258049 RepID=A0ABP4GSZ9_9ACTN